MKYLFFLVHPSKYKVFKHTINTLKENGHTVDITITSKDVLETLIKNEGWDYTNIFPEGRKIEGLPAKAGALYNAFRTIYRLNKYIGDNKYDLFITDDFLVVNGKLKNTPTIKFQDDDITAVRESALLLFFADYVLSPSVINIGRFQKKHIPFYGYKELGSLHSKRYIPNRSVVDAFHKNSKPYYIIRLVSLKATHDVNKKGLTNEDVRRLIDILEQKGSVYITSERPLPTEFEKYRLIINPNNIEHVLYYADLLISDSQTMSAESGVLGTPYIRFNDFVGKIEYLNELENKYKLGIGIKTKDKGRLFVEVEKLISDPDLKNRWKQKRIKMLEEKIDITDLFVWLFENFPQSANALMKNPEIQNKYISLFNKG